MNICATPECQYLVRQDDLCRGCERATKTEHIDTILDGTDDQADNDA